MRKPAFCIYAKNKGANQLNGNRAADWSFCFHSTSLIQNFKPLAIFCGRTAQFMSDLLTWLESLKTGFLAMRPILTFLSRQLRRPQPG